MSITEKSGFEQFRRNWGSRRRARHIDRHNRKQYGSRAPQFAERLWVPLSKLIYATKIGSSKDIGTVVDEWPDEQVPVAQTASIKACLAHWRDGVAWEDTGIYEVMMDHIRRNGKVDRLRTLADVKMRYQQLDSVYENVRKTGRLDTREELVPGNFREEGGILVHIGPEGAPFFGKKGHHRLAIALALDLDMIPAQLGAVYKPALAALETYR